MSDLKGFKRDLNKFADSIGVKTETVLKKISLQTFTGVVQKTPVDSGRARASWVIGIEKPVNSPVLPENQEFDPQQAADFSFQEISELNNLGPESTVFISNSLPYIEVLEEGSSQQAPEGMVAITLFEIERDIKRLVDEV